MSTFCAMVCGHNLWVRFDRWWRDRIFMIQTDETKRGLYRALMGLADGWSVMKHHLPDPRHGHLGLRFFLLVGYDISLGCLGVLSFGAYEALLEPGSWSWEYNGDVFHSQGGVVASVAMTRIIKVGEAKARRVDLRWLRPSAPYAIISTAIQWSKRRIQRILRCFKRALKPTLSNARWSATYLASLGIIIYCSNHLSFSSFFISNHRCIALFCCFDALRFISIGTDRRFYTARWLEIRMNSRSGKFSEIAAMWDI